MLTWATPSLLSRTWIRFPGQGFESLSTCFDIMSYRPGYFGRDQDLDWFRFGIIRRKWSRKLELDPIVKSDYSKPAFSLNLNSILTGQSLQFAQISIPSSSKSDAFDSRKWSTGFKIFDNPIWSFLLIFPVQFQ